MYANGPVYGVDWTNDWFLIVDPVNNSSSRLKIPTRAEQSTMSGLRQVGFQPFRHFGSTPVWNNPAGPHNPMLDETGRVWITTSIRGQQNPDYCKEGSANPYAQYYPLGRSFKQAGYYDPKTQKFTLDRYVLRHAPSAVRGGCRQHALLQRSRRYGDRLDQHEAVRQDR